MPGGLLDFIFGTRTAEQNEAQAAQERQWERQYGVPVGGLERPLLDPVDTVAGGLTALPRGILASVADMGVDVGLGALMDSAPKDSLLAAALTPKTAKKAIAKGISHNMPETVHAGPMSFKPKPLADAQLY